MSLLNKRHNWAEKHTVRVGDIEWSKTKVRHCDSLSFRRKKSFFWALFTRLEMLVAYVRSLVMYVHRNLRVHPLHFFPIGNSDILLL